MELFAIIGLLIAYFKYRNAKASGECEAERARIEGAKKAYEPKPLPENATRMQRVAHWLGLEEE